MLCAFMHAVCRVFHDDLFSWISHFILFYCSNSEQFSPIYFELMTTIYMWTCILYFIYKFWRVIFVDFMDTQFLKITLIRDGSLLYRRYWNWVTNIWYSNGIEFAHIHVTCCTEFIVVSQPRVVCLICKSNVQILQLREQRLKSMLKFQEWLFF